MSASSKLPGHRFNVGDEITWSTKTITTPQPGTIASFRKSASEEPMYRIRKTDGATIDLMDKQVQGVSNSSSSASYAAPASSSNSAAAGPSSYRALSANSPEFENEENKFSGMNDLEDDEAFFALRSTKLATGASALSILFNKLNGIPIESMNSVLDNSRTMKDFVANLSSALVSIFSPPPNSSASSSRKSRKARKYNRRQSRR